MRWRIADLYVRPASSLEQREQVLQRWYRAQLKTLIPPLLEKWQPVLGVHVDDWGVKKMSNRSALLHLVEQGLSS
jgi:predicted metal-dependent hydrolase